ncbi:MAG: hypothetical protein HKM07_07740 [Chlamydiae bacterium]|nr:hypothetical protein [Chlamydiota bacterium]
MALTTSLHQPQEVYYKYTVAFSNTTTQNRFVGSLELIAEKRASNISLKSILRLEWRNGDWFLSLKDRVSPEADQNTIRITSFSFTNNILNVFYNKKVDKNEDFLIPLSLQNNSDDSFELRMHKIGCVAFPLIHLIEENDIVLSSPPSYRCYKIQYSMIAIGQSQRPLGTLELTAETVAYAGLSHAIKVELENGIWYLRGKTLKIPDNQEFPTVKIRNFAVLRLDRIVHSEKQDLKDNNELNVPLFFQDRFSSLSQIAFALIGHSVQVGEQFVSCTMTHNRTYIVPLIASEESIGVAPFPSITLRQPTLPSIRSVFPDLFPNEKLN